MLYEELLVIRIVNGIFLLVSILLDFILYQIKDIAETFSNIGLATGIVLAIIPACLKYIFSNIKREKERKIQKKGYAVSFYNEIKEIERVIKPLVEYYEKFREPKDTGPVIIPGPYILNQAISETKVELNKFSSLYDKNNLYIQLQKEISLFDKNVIQSLFKFYTNLQKADEEYKIYINSIYGIYLNKNIYNKSPDINTAWKIQYDFIKHLQVANEEASNLINLFNIYIK